MTTDPRTARIADLAAALTALPDVEPATVRLARRAHQTARAELAAQLRAGAPQRVVEALRYRVERTADLLDQRWAQTLG